MGLPLAVEWNRFQRIKINIDHCQDHSRPYRWAGMREIIEWLRHGHPEILLDITIVFQEDDKDTEMRTSYFGDDM